MDLTLVLTRLTAAAATAVSTPARTITPYDWCPDLVEAPCIYPSDSRLEFDRTMRRGIDALTVTLHLLCSTTDDREGQRMLAGYLAGSGAGSIKAAIEAARGAPGVGALSGACDDLHVQSMSGIRIYPVGDVRYVGAEFVVWIIGSGT